VFVEPPKCFAPRSGKDLVLKLFKSLYGLRQAPRTFFKKLRSGLLENQPRLIEKVLKVTGMSDANGTHTQTTGAPVGVDLDGLDLRKTGNMHQWLEC